MTWQYSRLTTSTIKSANEWLIVAILIGVELLQISKTLIFCVKQIIVCHFSIFALIFGILNHKRSLKMPMARMFVNAECNYTFKCKPTNSHILSIISSTQIKNINKYCYNIFSIHCMLKLHAFEGFLFSLLMILSPGWLAA